MVVFEESHKRRKERIDLLKRFCESNKGELAQKVLAKFRLVTGNSLLKSQEYLSELTLAEVVILENNKIKEVKT